MPKGNANRNMNFRETRSERAGTASYRNFHNAIKKFFTSGKYKGIWKKGKTYES